MITIQKDKVILPRKTWDRLRKDTYFEELIENILDSEELIEEINTSQEFIDIRDYDKQRKSRKIQSPDK